MAIMWANQGVVGNDSDHFQQFYGESVAPLARQIVRQAIIDWEAVITDFNYDGDQNAATNNFLNNTLTLDISATPLGSTDRGVTIGSSLVYFNGRPTTATIQLDDNGGGGGWFFDATPQDDAEFTGIANSGASGTGPAFQGSFIDVAQTSVFDFYNTIRHEIGHAVGIALQSQALLTAFTGPTFADDPNETNPVFVLRQFNGPTTTATLTTAGGTHIYEGTAASPVHPNDFMNAGRTNIFSSLPIKPTLRREISDLVVNILRDAYGYGVNLPALDTAHVTLDSLTGTLLVQGGMTTQGIAQNDAITIDTVGSDIRVRLFNGTVDYATERVPASLVRRIVVSAAGDGGIPNLDSTVTAPVSVVYYVVSSNQDAVDADAVGNGFVDLDGVVPGQQVTVRAAIRDASGGSTIYVPRGRYKFSISGAGGIEQGDLDITQSITLMGTGAGETIIDANFLDRVFDVIGSGKTLTLDSLTVTGGVASGANVNGGGISVASGAFLNVQNAAIVSNQTTGAGYGGAIYFDQLAGGSIVSSVITSNDSANIGGVFLAGSTGATVTATGSIFAGNGPSSPPNNPSDAWSGGRSFSSNGFNRLGRTVTTIGFTSPGDFIGNTANQIVTGIADTYDGSSDVIRKSLRDAINVVATDGEIWVPAWKFTLTRGRTMPLLTSTDTPSTVGDVDIARSMKIIGVGAGQTIIDAGGDTGISDRVFDVVGGALTLDSLTVTGGRAPNDMTIPGFLSHGGGVFVQDGGSLILVTSALVDNETTHSAALGGAIYFTRLASGSLTNSVITNNDSASFTGGVYLGGSSGSFGQVTVTGTIIAENDAALPAGSEFAYDVATESTGRDFDSNGNNRIGLNNNASDLGFNQAGDHAGHVDYIVTSIADTYDTNPASDNVVLSLRDAIDKANTTPGAQEIWLPAWNFLLTRQRTSQLPSTETNISEGDLEVNESLTIRGVGTTTSVAWRPGTATDKVFELWGDYNSNLTVDSGDYVQYRKQQGMTGSGLASDGDEDGDVDPADYQIYINHFGNTLTLLNVA